ncbi:MAG: glycoside hydrolase family 3 C-terminal domain-containing protein [Erysipelotrichaceae bacterium]|jgi:beta-glucosidase|nr:glycoside hydrolase family 3 C-terminal domain-containing protein [Erysipelotrichaceae bacterium]MCI1326865.1 glycoside hydrolase family 3 C-terminal domain-containing protein [Solobacterium sp.]MCH4043707.1 glycoside hydrolase family 3 C-terminal domain-containing protein [Erysipelotrichaceae bacterium]MCH4120926.1 glycoside hydrolase family 3 C-terminal domain-containing protein [Erysipelotrichaceae bacterium]MCI1363565.1 glycoside hydrolase family 3 C-terminal domain-containing protein [S
MKKHAFCEQLLKEMTLDEKIQQVSCIMPLLVSTSGKVDPEKLKKVLPNGIGRMTQFCGGFVQDGKQAAEAYNAIQKYQIENTPHHIPVLIQNESACGLQAAGATVFPVPLAIGASFKPESAEKMGEVIQEQARAIGIRECLSPVVDVARDSRWGRVDETFGEDPTLTAAMGVNKVHGLQQNDYGSHVISCAKHFMGYSASENGTNCAVINIGEKMLKEAYGYPWAAMIQKEDLEALMVTYSEIDGEPMSVNHKYMKDWLVDEIGFQGAPICDGGSIERVYEANGIGKDEEDIAIRAAQAGLVGDTPITQFYPKLKDAIESGRMKEEVLDRIVLAVLNEKADLGLFENPYVDPDKANEILAKQDGRDLSYQMARDALTLLKNKDHILPLENRYKKIALTGPFADRVIALFGGYAYPTSLGMMFSAVYNAKGTMEGGFGDFFQKMVDVDQLARDFNIDDSLSYNQNIENFFRRKYHYQSIVEGMKQQFKDADINANNAGLEMDSWEDDLKQAVENAKDADVIIVCGGEITGFDKNATAGEGINNPNLRLPGKQEELIHELHKLNKPVILVLLSGRGMELTPVIDDVDAIIDAYYPGPYGARAIAEALYGTTTPGGKLPVTFPRLSSQEPMYYGHNAGSGYRGINGEDVSGGFGAVITNTPLYPFGYGLSYTTFELSDLKLTKEVPVDGTVTISVQVKNTGTAAGDEVPQIYFRTVHPSVNRPVLELRAFCRITLQPGEIKTVTFHVPIHALGYYNREMKFVVEPGEVEVYAGTSSADLPLQDEFLITGDVEDITKNRDFLFTSEVR